MSEAKDVFVLDDNNAEYALYHIYSNNHDIM